MTRERGSRVMDKRFNVLHIMCRPARRHGAALGSSTKARTWDLQINR
jgi:hypothetical protein